MTRVRYISVLVVLATLVGAGCGDDDRPTLLDGGGDAAIADGARPDAPMVPRDSGGTPDAGTPMGDAAMPLDGALPDGALPGDAGLPTVDAGPDDAGPDDAGLPATDAGSPTDAGIPATDAGSPTDAGVPPSDAAAPIDGGSALPGDVCATAETIGAGTTMGTTIGYTGDYGSGTGCAGTAGLDRVYALVVPAGQRMTATIAPVGAGYDPSISLQSDVACGVVPRVCLAGDDSGGAATVNRVVYANVGTTDSLVYIVIDSYTGADAGGDFTLVVSLATPGPGDACSTATAVAIGTYPGETTVGFANDYTGGTGCTATAGLDHVYAVSVPDGQLLSASVTPEGPAGYNPSIMIVNGPAAACEGTRTCVSSDDSGAAGATNTARFSNASGSAAVVYIIVDSASAADTGGTYTLVLALSTPAAGDVCGTATAVTPGTYGAETTIGYANDYTGGTGCSATAGLDHVYSIDVPAGEALTATVTPVSAPPFDPSIMIVDGPVAACAGARTCLDVDDSGGAATVNTVVWTNGTGASRTVYIVIDSFTGSDTGGTYTLDIAVAAPPAGDVCASAAALTSGVALTAETTVGYANDYGAGTMCQGTGGADRAYSITIPIGGTLTVVVTPSATYDPSINLVAGPATDCGVTPRTCLDGVDPGFAGDVETLIYTNTSGAALDVFVIVDGFSATGGVYDIVATLT